MATRQKTIEFAFPTLAAIVDDTLTTFTQITLYIPESSPVFRSVFLRFTADDTITATGGTVTTKTVQLQLAAVGYHAVANANALTHNAKNQSVHIVQDFTSVFTDHWTGTSMTCNLQVQLKQSTGTTLGWVNGSATLEITYDYDDTSTTHIKTVYIPLNAPVGALATSKPATIDTIPALDTFCPEDTKTYRNIFIVVQGMEYTTYNTTDFTITAQIDALTAVTTGSYEAGLYADRNFRYVWNITALGMTTNATHSWYIWASAARAHHLQAYLVVTYEFVIASTTSVLNSLLLPMKFHTPMGGTTNADYQRASIDLWIEEPATVAVQNSALLFFYNSYAAIGTVSARIGTGAFTDYANPSTVTEAGEEGFMLRCESVLSLARGRNVLQADIYRAASVNLGYVSALWIINYTSGKHGDGVGAHNHTVRWGLASWSTTAPIGEIIVAATAPAIPETNYFISNIGAQFNFDGPTTVAFGGSGSSVQVERLAADGGVGWDSIVEVPGHQRPYPGNHIILGDSKNIFKRFPTDAGSKRIDLETARRWRLDLACGWLAFFSCQLLYTYHSIAFAVAGTVAGSGGGTVNLYLHRSGANTYDKGELLASTTRSGNGAYSFVWYDNVENVFVEAYEDSTHMGRTDDGVAA
jgi:hypothetical protein